MKTGENPIGIAEEAIIAAMMQSRGDTVSPHGCDFCAADCRQIEDDRIAEIEVDCLDRQDAPLGAFGGNSRDDIIRDHLAESVLQGCRIEQAVRRQQLEGGARPINVVFG